METNNEMILPMESKETDKIIKAVFDLQSELPTVPKNTKGYGYKYANLDDIMGVLKPLLTKHNLILSQPLTQLGDKLFVVTKLYHTSGQFISCMCPCEVNTSDSMSTMQRIGTAITYARRYSLSLINLITDEDTDDANNKPTFTKKPIATSKPSFSKKKTTSTEPAFPAKKTEAKWD